jgi:hypothetical protein
MSEEGQIREGEEEVDLQAEETEAEDDFELHGPGGGKKGGGGSDLPPIQGPVPS